MDGDQDGNKDDDGGDDGDKEGNDDDDGGNDDDGAIDGGDDGGVVGISDGMADGAGLNEGLDDGNAKEEGDALSCKVTVIVTTSAAALLSFDESDTPRAIANATARRNTWVSRSLTRGCLSNGRVGSK